MANTFWSETGSTLVVNGDTITNNNRHLYQTAYGAQTFCSTDFKHSKFTVEWQVEIVAKKTFIAFGISNNTSYKEHEFWSDKQNNNICYVYTTRGISKPEITSHLTGVVWAVLDDESGRIHTGNIFTIKLDFKAKTLSFYKDNKLIGGKPAFENVITDANVNYRLAVCTIGCGDSVRLISCNTVANNSSTNGCCVLL